MVVLHKYNSLSFTKSVFLTSCLVSALLFWRYLLPVGDVNDIAEGPSETSAFQSNSADSNSDAFQPQLVDFWRMLAEVLQSARPKVDPVEIIDNISLDGYQDFHPLETNKTRLQRLNLSSSQEAALQQSHRLVEDASKKLAPDLYFNPGTTGIVTTASLQYLPIALVSLRLLRRTGSTLPVEIFLDEYSEAFCKTHLPPLNARCRVFGDIYNQASNVSQPHHFQYKALAILFSSFQHVLFLDADAFPITDPSVLFTRAPYMTTGLITFPDFWANTASPSYFEIAGIPQIPLYIRQSSESGQLYLNKAVHAASLILITYYNYYGPDFYYPLLSQGNHGEGDKETFIHGAMAARAPFYQVSTSPGHLGHFRDGQFRFVGVTQADPRDDFAILRASWSSLLAPWRGSSREPRPLFVHQMRHKLDLARIMREGLVRDEKGGFNRMWGSEEDAVRRFGRDVEKEVWEVLVETACTDGVDGLCGEVRAYWDSVFGGR